MKTRDFILVIFAVIIAFLVIKVLWTITAILIQIIIFLAAVFIIYLFLKKIL